jgi:hypothetical protein
MIKSCRQLFSDVMKGLAVLVSGWLPKKGVTSIIPRLSFKQWHRSSGGKVFSSKSRKYWKKICDSSSD